MDAKNLYDAVIIGGGPAGLTAALYLARARYRVIVVEKEKFGGQITITSEVVNYPGSAPVSGTELTERMRKQAEGFGAEFLLAEVTGLLLDGDIRTVNTSRGALSCFAVLLATGAHPRMVGFPGEEEFKGHGVAYCATCDGEFFTGREVFVVGGGFAAAEEGVFLTRYASHVTILIRGDDFRCAKATADEARNHEKITVLTNTEVVQAEGDGMLRSLTYRNTKTGETTTWRPGDGGTFGIFVFAGYAPSTELVRDLAEVDEQGYIVTGRDQRTTAEGLYAAGDVCRKSLRQVVTATGDGALAATEIERYAGAMQKKTGLRPAQAVSRVGGAAGAGIGQAAGTALGEAGAGTGQAAPAMSGSPGAGGAASSGDFRGDSSLFTDDMVQQLNSVFARMERPLILKLYLDERPVSAELKRYMEELAALSPLLSVEVAGAAADAGSNPPCVRVLTADGTQTGLAFHGVPGGHEFTSFVLGLYNASGPGQRMDETLKESIMEFDRDVHFDILVSLTCTMCPELVTSAQRIASLNPRVTTDVYDLNHFPELRGKYNVMSVPCFLINDGKPMFGKKSTEELFGILKGLP